MASIAVFFIVYTASFRGYDDVFAVNERAASPVNILAAESQASATLKKEKLQQEKASQGTCEDAH